MHSFYILATFLLYNELCVYDFILFQPKRKNYEDPDGPTVCPENHHKVYFIDCNHSPAALNSHYHFFIVSPLC